MTVTIMDKVVTSRAGHMDLETVTATTTRIVMATGVAKIAMVTKTATTTEATTERHCLWQDERHFVSEISLPAQFQKLC